MIGIALVLGVPLAILVALYLVSPQRWRKASVPADALPFRNKAFSALKRAALAWAWGMLAMLLASAALAELPFPVPFSILGWSVPVVALLAAVWGTLRPRAYEDRVDRVRNGARSGRADPLRQLVQQLNAGRPSYLKSTPQVEMNAHIMI